MKSASPQTRDRFDRLYAQSSDPWNYRTSGYERLKYDQTLAALPERRLAKTLEIGCSIGVFTAMLTERSTDVVAVDFSPAAVELAAANLADRQNVRILQAAFPDQIPDEIWDVVVCSEVLYYLSDDVFGRALNWLRAQLETGSSVLAVSWRGIGRDEPMTGDQAHDRLCAEFASWHVLDRRRSEYRLDRFDGDGH